MTTPLVQSISDEQLAELEEAATDSKLNIYRPFGWDHSVRCGNHLQTDQEFLCASSPQTILSLIARLRAAEVDAKAAHQRVKELDLLFGRYLLGMKASVIEMDHGRGAAAAMQWIINGLEGPGELPPEDELDAQAFFDREIKPINDAMAELFEARRAAMERTP